MDISKSPKIGLSLVAVYLHQHLFVKLNKTCLLSLHPKMLQSPTFIIYFHLPDSKTLLMRGRKHQSKFHDPHLTSFWVRQIATIFFPLVCMLAVRNLSAACFQWYTPAHCWNSTKQPWYAELASSIFKWAILLTSTQFWHHHSYHSPS